MATLQFRIYKFGNATKFWSVVWSFRKHDFFLYFLLCKITTEMEIFDFEKTRCSFLVQQTNLSISHILDKLKNLMSAAFGFCRIPFLKLLNWVVHPPSVNYFQFNFFSTQPKDESQKKYCSAVWDKFNYTARYVTNQLSASRSATLYLCHGPWGFFGSISFYFSFILVMLRNFDSKPGKNQFFVNFDTSK